MGKGPCRGNDTQKPRPGRRVCSLPTERPVPRPACRAVRTGRPHPHKHVCVYVSSSLSIEIRESTLSPVSIVLVTNHTMTYRHKAQPLYHAHGPIRNPGGRCGSRCFRSPGSGALAGGGWAQTGTRQLEASVPGFRSTPRTGGGAVRPPEPQRGPSAGVRGLPTWPGLPHIGVAGPKNKSPGMGLPPPASPSVQTPSLRRPGAPCGDGLRPAGLPPRPHQAVPCPPPGRCLSSHSGTPLHGRPCPLTPQGGWHQVHATRPDLDKLPGYNLHPLVLGSSVNYF